MKTGQGESGPQTHTRYQDQTRDTAATSPGLRWAIQLLTAKEASAESFEMLSIIMIIAPATICLVKGFIFILKREGDLSYAMTTMNMMGYQIGREVNAEPMRNARD